MGFVFFDAGRPPGVLRAFDPFCPFRLEEMSRPARFASLMMDGIMDKYL
jgi:hypothetical protein